MLGKIIKHEFKATYKGYFLLFASLLALTLMTKITEQVPLDNTVWNILMVLLAAAYMIVLVFVVFAAMILAVQRFYKTMVKDEGYLTHTIPVKKSSLILGKFIVALIWTIISGIIMLLSIFVEAATTDFMEVVIDALNAFIKFVSENPEYILHIVLLLIMVIVSFAASILMFYAAVALGQMFNGHKIAGSVVFYFVLNYGFSFLSTAAMMVIPNFIDKMNATDEMSFAEMMGSGINAIDWFLIFIIVFQLICCVVCYFITNYRFSKRLNLE